VIWEKDLGKEYQVRVLQCRPSPLIEGNLLIVFTGAKPGASVIALDKSTGKEVWKALDDPVSNSSPLVTIEQPASGFLSPINQGIPFLGTFTDDGPAPYTAQWVVWSATLPASTIPGTVSGFTVRACLKKREC
jgi:hypothetical protein